MNPFVIQCLTCRARLKVTDPAVVGDVIECPKCGSFVEVTPPAGWQASGAAPIPSSTGSTISLPSRSKIIERLSAARAASKAAPVPAATPPAAAAPAPTASVPAVSVPKTPTAAAKAAAPPVAPAAKIAALQMAAAPSPPPLPGNSGLRLKGAAAAATNLAASAPPVVAPAVAPTPASSSGLVLPADALGHDGPGMLSQAWQLASMHWRIIVGGTAGALIVAAVLIVWSGSRAADDAAGPATTNIAATTDDMAQTTDPQSATSDKADAEVGGPAQSNEEPNPAPADAGTTGPADADSDKTQPPAEQTADDAADKPEEPAVPAKPIDPTKPLIASSDPLDPIARALANDKGPLGGPNADEAPAEPMPPAASTADEMDTADESGLDPVKQAKLMSHLRDKVAPIEFSGVMLGQFVSFLSEYSTVPIEIDSKSVMTVGKGAKTKISVKLGTTTVEEALQAVLKQQGLAYHVEPGKLVITAGAAKAKP